MSQYMYMYYSWVEILAPGLTSIPLSSLSMLETQRSFYTGHTWIGDPRPGYVEKIFFVEKEESSTRGVLQME